MLRLNFFKTHVDMIKKKNIEPDKVKCKIREILYDNLF